MAANAGAADQQRQQGLLAQEDITQKDMADAPAEPSTPAVRFKSTIEEIAPENTGAGPPPPPVIREHPLGEPGEVTPEQIRDLSKRLNACPLQERRMSIFSYEAFSLPPSRTASHDEDSREPSREATRSSAGHNSPRLPPSMRSSEMHTPPLTPAGTESVTEGDLQREHRAHHDRDRVGRTPDIITPQDSSSHEPASPARPPNQQAASSEQPSPRSVAFSEREHLHANVGDHRKGLFSLGPGTASPSGSVPVSRESSPSRITPASQFYTRQQLPQGDLNDPYAAARRQAQNTAPHSVEPRFMFSRKKKSSSPSSSTISLPRAHDRRHGRREEDDSIGAHSRSSSMANLTRFFKVGPKAKRSTSPAPSVRSERKTPPGSKAGPVQMPFGDDHGLSSKYGKLGKVLGAGAGGSVRLMKRAEDGVIFAVKEFRPRHSYETEREYVKKLTAEYCIGSSLHHGNVIETLDIVQEKGKWYEVMEYGPYDLFAIVMTGKMSREEVTCSFLQILSGVTYLHSMGLAHRDLKLDNVVVSEHGVMKIIDFGSAHVFKYPFESGLVLASGIVGSDPYLAPEVYDERKYDPQAVDIWSLAIIYCCMTLRRFPWKVPRLTDSSFKLFAAEPSPGHDPKKLMLPPAASTTALSDVPARDFDPNAFRSTPDREKTEDHHHHQRSSTTEGGSGGGGSGAAEGKREVVRGPWRILRLLPRESRHVIGRMLEIDPKKRATMSEILDDPWVANTIICRQMEGCVVVKGEDHTHILEPPSGGKEEAKP
ncbi:hypothetical protein OQA88_12919 [Cercophora sp. LCS_1]